MTAPLAADTPARRARAAALAFVVLGVALRVAVAYPVHAYAADADCLNCGLVAFRVADGDFPVWLTPRRAGALECYEHAGLFHVFGVSRGTLAIAPIFSTGLLLAVWSALALALLGPLAGALAVLLLALPPPAYLFWTYMPNGYPETMLLCGVVLLLADLARRDPRAIRLIGFGFAAGLGFWNSIQTLCATGPAALWLAVTGPREVRSRRVLALAAAGFVLGAFPWIAWNVKHTLGSFRNNFSVRPVGGFAGAAENVAYLVRYGLPELVASTDPENGANPPTPFQKALQPIVLAVWGTAALAGLGVTAVAIRRAHGEGLPRWILLPFVGFTLLALATISQAGVRRGLTVRYVMPVFLPLAAALGSLLAAVARRSRVTAGAVLLAVLSFNVSGYFLPGGAARRRWEEWNEADQRLIAFLDEQKIDVVCGDYWSVYQINFLTREKVRAIPFERDFDYYAYEAAMPDVPHRWAVLGRSYAALEKLAVGAGFSGAIARLGEERYAFVPEENPPKTPGTVDFLRRFRSAFHWP